MLISRNNRSLKIFHYASFACMICLASASNSSSNLETEEFKSEVRTYCNYPVNSLCGGSFADGTINFFEKTFGSEINHFPIKISSLPNFKKILKELEKDGFENVTDYAENYVNVLYWKKKTSDEEELYLLGVKCPWPALCSASKVYVKDLHPVDTGIFKHFTQSIFYTFLKTQRDKSKKEKMSISFMAFLRYDNEHKIPNHLVFGSVDLPKNSYALKRNDPKYWCHISFVDPNYHSSIKTPFAQECLKEFFDTLPNSSGYFKLIGTPSMTMSAYLGIQKVDGPCGFLSSIFLIGKMNGKDLSGSGPQQFSSFFELAKEHYPAYLREQNNSLLQLNEEVLHAKENGWHTISAFLICQYNKGYTTIHQTYLSLKRYLQEKKVRRSIN